ncbi:glycosyltransferase family A protein [Microbacterium awajiense]|uniref:glycosyltransferase family 2 protein n=1 Tax=Microbacterium awajiense TaxID=415214 RepID=UPI0031DE6858
MVIPTNRGGPYLSAAVDSLRAQSSAPTEVILVDDGSPPPGLSEVADRLGLTYLRKDAGGISSARNLGAEHAVSEWIAFLDDDDMWHPDRLKLQLAALDDNPHAIGAFTGGQHIDEAGLAFGDPWGAPSASAEDMLTGRTPTPRVTTLLVSRDAYLAVGGCRTRFEPSEDNDLIARLLLQGNLVAVDQTLVFYRRHASNVTRRGLRGLQAGRSSIREMTREARRNGDEDRHALMRARYRSFAVNASDQSLGEVISAVRSGELGYAARVLYWSAMTFPVATARAAARRLRARGGK